MVAAGHLDAAARRPRAASVRGCAFAWARHVVDCLATHPSQILPRVLGEFSDRWTAVRIQIEVGSAQKLAQDILDSKLHAAVGPNERPINGLEFVPLYQEQHQLYCGVEHPLFAASTGHSDLGQLAKYPFVARGYMYEKDIERVKAVNVRAVVDSLEAMAILLLSGRFIGFLPAHFAQQWVDCERLRPILSDKLAYVSNHALITKKSESKKSPVLRAFARDLKAAIHRDDLEVTARSNL